MMPQNNQIGSGKNRKIIILTGTVAILACTTLIASLLFVLINPVFVSKFNKINYGQSEQVVIDVLGEPDERGTDFKLGQQSGFEDEYSAAASSSSVRYIFWRHGDVVYAVGLDAEGKVAYKAAGGT